MVNGEVDGFGFAHDGVLVERVRTLLESLGVRSLSHVPRSGNGVAHVIASRVARLEGRHVWLGVGPDWLMDVISNDRPVTASSSSREASGATLPTTDISRIM